MDLEVTHHIHTGLTEDHLEAARALGGEEGASVPRPLTRRCGASGQRARPAPGSGCSLKSFLPLQGVHTYTRNPRTAEPPWAALHICDFATFAVAWLVAELPAVPPGRRERHQVGADQRARCPADRRAAAVNRRSRRRPRPTGSHKLTTIVARSILLFAIAEIGGAWLIWQGVRCLAHQRPP